MLFRHTSDMRTQQNEHMRGGKGTVTVKHMLNPDELCGKGRLFAEMTVPPGASVGLHRHEGEVEAYYYLQGSGLYHDNEQAFEIRAGDMTLVSDHNSHSVENTGDVPLVLIALILYTEDRK